MECRYCKITCVKAGHSAIGTQRFRCRSCRKYQQESYRHHARLAGVDESIVSLLTEGIGIRGISRVLKISATTVISRIKAIAGKTSRPSNRMSGGIYEIDELWTYVGSKQTEVWITYALNRQSKAVIDFTVGSRTKERLSTVARATLALQPRNVCTDGLPVYRSLIPYNLHRVGLPHTRRIERFNLNLRTHLKRLSRKTIAFSKTDEMLDNCLKIYFWRREICRHATTLIASKD
jgi:insertion element IS1 protein InsB